MDIRKYFSPMGGKKKDSSFGRDSHKKEEKEAARGIGKRQRIIDSDSDDDIFVDKVVDKKESKKKTQTKASPQPQSAKLKPKSAADFFSSSPVTRTDRSSAVKKENDDDSDFAKTLQQLDETGDSNPTKKPKLDPQSPQDEKPKPNENSPPNKIPKKSTSNSNWKEKSPDKHLHDVEEPSSEKNLSAKLSAKLKAFECKKRDLEEHGRGDKLSHKDKKIKTESRAGLKTEEKMPEKPGKGKSSFKEEKNRKEVKTETKERKGEKRSTPMKVEKTSAAQVEGEAGAGEAGAGEAGAGEAGAGKDGTTPSKSADPEERKKHARESYMKFLRRSGPANPGSKPIPEGEPDCLQGLVFVLSGVFESLDREEAAELIKKYGGKVTSSVSRNTSYLVLGSEPGASKVAKAQQLGTKQIDEDELLNMIGTRPGKEQKPVVSQGKSADKLKGSAKKAGKEVKVESSPKPSKSSSQDARSSSSSSASSAAHTPSPKLSSLSHLSHGSQDSTSSSNTSSPKTQPLSSQELSTRPSETLMWVDKYKPMSVKNIIGQQGDRSNVKKLLKWLQNWQKNQLSDKKPPRPSPWAKDDDGAFFKCALLSGPPGVGKTTSAHLVCKELGFDFIEMNASDARSKKTLDQVVSECLSNKSLASFVSSQGGSPSARHVLVMDEVDGMSGNEDRGGVQELIALIKKSRIPIIAMCNDRNHPKIRSLANHCFDLRFQKPRIEQIRGPMMSVCFRENIKIKPDALDQIILGSNQDVRQILHHLSMWSANQQTLELDSMKKEAAKAKKDLKKGPWDVCRAVFTQSEHKNMNIYEKSDLFFHDYSIGPLFVQENYPKVVPHVASGNRQTTLQQLAKTAASIADGDLVEKAIRSSNAWSLLPTQAMFSSVLPGEYMSGHLSAQIEFPRWLGQRSKRNKFDRLMQELQMHMRIKISGSKLDVGLDYCGPVQQAVVRPLVQQGGEGVGQAVQVMKTYDLLREDLEAMQELSHWPGKKDPMTGVESKVKAAFTRTFNKESHMSPFAAPTITKKKKRAAGGGGGEDLYGEDEEEEEEEDEEDDLSTSAMIKVKKGGSNKKGGEGGSSGGRGGSGGGRGRGGAGRGGAGRGGAGRGGAGRAKGRTSK